jgi:hypothetical protein
MELSSTHGGAMQLLKYVAVQPVGFGTAPPRLVELAKSHAQVAASSKT